MEEPAVRIKQLAELADYQLDMGRPARMYFRSGAEMVRMANVYAEEGNLEGAYVLYLKFMTIFVEKIRQHPDYKQVPASEKAAIRRHLEATLPRAEAIKRQLAARYEKEHRQFLEEQRRRQQELEATRQRRQQEEAARRNFSEEKQRLLQLERRRAEELERSLDGPPTHEPGGLPPAAVPGYVELLPAVPSAPPSLPAAGPAAPEKTPTPAVDRSVKPDVNRSLLSVRSEPRTLVVPDSLMTRFLQLAQANTSNNVETCGLLCGRPARDLLYVTHLLVPAQTGTPDSCSMQAEEDVFHYQDQHNLITLGWIHTHPSQTAFLSSVDLHTHCPYQLMMMESVAIVCAPKYNETGFFQLTPDHGLDYIARCRQQGFHPHPEHPPLFQDAQHVTRDDSYQITVVDLRPH